MNRYTFRVRITEPYAGLDYVGEFPEGLIISVVASDLKNANIKVGEITKPIFDEIVKEHPKATESITLIKIVV